mmetsp:Transcript_54845/g.130228  ORF Transcript_54845/g.130228 Transcript_54845/m.130228 type:complete len:127 (-) Transcript_54845:143-523(-)
MALYKKCDGCKKDIHVRKKVCECGHKTIKDRGNPNWAGTGPQQECPKCKAMVHTRVASCPKCNHTFYEKDVVKEHKPWVAGGRGRPPKSAGKQAAKVKAEVKAKAPGPSGGIAKKSAGRPPKSPKA